MREKPWKNEHIYNSFDDLIRLAETAAEKQIFQYGSIINKVLRERTIQRIVQMVFYPYCANCTMRAKMGNYPFPSKEEILKLDGVLVDCKTGKLKLTSKLFFRLWLDYLVEWLRIMTNLISGFFAADKKHNQSATWIFGLGYTDLTAGGSETAFEAFCKRGPIKPLTEAEYMIIQEMDLHKPMIHGMVYTRNPLHYQLRKCHIGFLSRLQLLVNCLFDLIKYLAITVRQPLMAVLSKDIIQYGVVRSLDENRLIRSVIITNSSFFQQPLWMRWPDNRNFRVHELHYGQNAIPFLYKDDQVAGIFPPFRHVKVDEHWVWTEGYKSFIKETGHKGPIHVVGPIVWYLPEKNEIKRIGKKITIAVFDVAPVYQSVADKMGIIYYYYTANKLIEFLAGIITVCEELTKELNRDIRIILKSKRHFTEGLHDKSYIDYVNMIQRRYQQIEVADYRSNIFSLIDECDFSVSIPYTTVPYVAAYLQKPAAYYDPYSELIFTNEPSPYIQTASGKQELKQLIENIVLSTTSSI